ncbi:MAG: hypothetical protein KAV87_58160, partial [Desulfobacteraceae bacterium]|nr:hypothetical protein [Desulfobacteraceae bacterium]
MFRTSTKGVFLLTILASTRILGQQTYPELHQEGRAKWEDIVLPKTYVFDNADSVPENAKLLSEAEVEGYFQHLRWKRGVQLFEYYRTIARELLASLDDKTSWIHPENIGYFIEKIDSEAKAFELVMSFHSGVLLTGEADIESLMEVCRDSKVAQVAEGMPEAIEPICRFDPKLGAYRVSFCMYHHKNVFEAKYLITPDGRIGYSIENYVIGPVTISGWRMSRGAEFERYQKTGEAFERAIAEPLEKMALKVMTNTELEKKGLAKGQENALRWLSSWGDVKEHAASIVEFLDAKGDMIDPSVKKRALLKLKSVGAGLLKEERITPTVPVGPKPIQRKKTFWPWPFLLIGTVVGIGVLYLVLLIKKKAISRGKSR